MSKFKEGDLVKIGGNKASIGNYDLIVGMIGEYVTSSDYIPIYKNHVIRMGEAYSINPKFHDIPVKGKWIVFEEDLELISKPETNKDAIVFLKRKQG